MTNTNSIRAGIVQACRLAVLIGAAFLSLAIVHQDTVAQSNETDTSDPSVQAGESLPGMDSVQEGSQSEQEDLALPFQPRRGLSFLQLLTRGGWFMIPLGLLSLFVVVIGVERFIALRREKLFPKELVHDLAALSQNQGGLDPRQAYQICQRFPSSAAYIIRSMLTRVGRPQMEIENAVNEASQREAARLNHLGSWLTLAAAIAPLIGLLGTVWGITQAFYDTTQLVAGQNRAEALAQGIYTALVTTMCGLLIAIPAAIMAHFYENRIIALLNDIEEMIYSLLPQFERYEGQLRYTTGKIENGNELAVASGVRDYSNSEEGESRLPVTGPKPKHRPAR